jgi:hypothetical protein
MEKSFLYVSQSRIFRKYYFYNTYHKSINTCRFIYRRMRHGEIHSIFPGEDINLNIKTGQTLNPKEPLAVALRENRSLREDVSAGFYGFEFTGTANSIQDKH